MVLTKHFDRKLLPSDLNWAPMNTMTYLVPDLVPIRKGSPRYVEVHEMFFATMDPDTIEIKLIIRIQNLALWEKYDRYLSLS